MKYFRHEIFAIYGIRQGNIMVKVIMYVCKYRTSSFKMA